MVGYTKFGIKFLGDRFNAPMIPQSLEISNLQKSLELSDLPFDVILNIAKYLNEKDLRACCHVNRHWYHTFNNDAIWKEAEKYFTSNTFDFELSEVSWVARQFKHCESLKSFLNSSLQWKTYSPMLKEPVSPYDREGIYLQTIIGEILSHPKNFSLR